MKKQSGSSIDRNPFDVLEDDDDSSDEEDSLPKREIIQKEVDVDKRKRTKLSSPALTAVPKTIRTFSNSTVNLLTYNVLADHLCKPSWFPYRSKQELDWRVRRELIKAKILEADCAIVCLQEVQVFHGPEHLRGNEHHFSWFDKWMRQEKRYTGALGSRQNASGKQPPGVQIGNLLYWKEDMFEPLLVQQCVPLLQTISNASLGDKEMKKLYCNTGVRGTVATLAALQCRISGRIILVATTHLPAPRHDNDCGSKLEQLVHLCALLHEISLFAGRVKKGVDAILICGDLNSTPDNEVCQLLKTGRLTVEKTMQLIKMGGRLRAPFVNQETGCIQAPPIPVARRYDTSGVAFEAETQSYFFHNALKRGLGGDIRFTNHTEKFTGWLDHVYAMDTPGAILSVTSSDPSADIDSTRYLPDAQSGHGSDHLPVKCEVTFAKRDTGLDDTEAETFLKCPIPIPVFPSSGETGDGSDEPRLVDDISDEESILREIEASLVTEKCVLAFDLQGINISRLGRIGLVVLKCISLDDDEIAQAIAFDPVALEWKSRGFPATLKNLLEDLACVKVAYDVRRDSDALYHLYGINLANVLDLQVLDQGIRLVRGEAMPERPKNWVPHVPSLFKVSSNFVDNGLRRRLLRPNAWEKQMPHVWTTRPLPSIVLEFAACQLHMIEAVFRGMRRKHVLTEDLLKKVETHSRRAIHDFRSRDVPVVEDGDWKTIMEEVSILKPWSGETNAAPSLGVWKRLALLQVSDHVV